MIDLTTEELIEVLREHLRRAQKVGDWIDNDFKAGEMRRGRFEIGDQACSSSSSALASFKSSVSNPSVNQP
jgi:hypothetical protein